MMTIAERAAAEKISASIVVSGEPAPDDMPPGTVTWDVVLTHGITGGQVSSLMFTGPATGALTMVDALDLLISDVSIVLDNDGLASGGAEDGFEGYCGDFELNTDSRAAFAKWEEMIEAGRELRDFFGGDQQLSTWVYDTERL